MAPVSYAYLGPPGTFSEEAALDFGGADSTYLPLGSMPAVVTAVETGAASAGVFPIENVLEGGVTTTLDLLIHETNLQISGEMVLPIRHYLLARPEISLAQIKVLYVHPQTLGQCRRFIERCLPGVVTIASLSNSQAPAEALADERPAAAIGTRRAAELTGAHILARDVQDYAGNVTRFVTLSREDHSPTGTDRTSFCFSTEDRPGALVAVLQELSTAGINMSKLESRPGKTALGEYVFLVDIEGHRTDRQVADVLERVRQRARMMKVFGSYPRQRNLTTR